MNRVVLDFDSSVPLHHQLSEAIRERIRSGEIQPGYQLPSERELCNQLGLSRGTVRQSLSSLVSEGLVFTRRGKGNFVAAHKIEQALFSFPSMVLSMGRGKHRVATSPLGVSTVPASPAVAASLAVSPGVPVIQVKRLRLLDDEPFLLTTSVVPEARCPRLVEDDHQSSTVYELLEHEYAIPILRVKSTLETTVLDHFEASLLAVQPSLPAFRLERTAFTVGDVPLVFTVHLIRGDRCRFSFELGERAASPVEALAG